MFLGFPASNKHTAHCKIPVITNNYNLSHLRWAPLQTWATTALPLFRFEFSYHPSKCHTVWCGADPIHILCPYLFLQRPWHESANPNRSPWNIWNLQNPAAHMQRAVKNFLQGAGSFAGKDSSKTFSSLEWGSAGLYFMIWDLTPLFVNFKLIRKEQTCTNQVFRSWWSGMYTAHIPPWLLCCWQINLCVLLLPSLTKYTRLQQEA